MPPSGLSVYIQLLPESIFVPPQASLTAQTHLDLVALREQMLQAELSRDRAQHEWQAAQADHMTLRAEHSQLKSKYSELGGQLDRARGEAAGLKGRNTELYQEKQVSGGAGEGAGQDRRLLPFWYCQEYFLYILEFCTANFESTNK